MVLRGEGLEVLHVFGCFLLFLMFFLRPVVLLLLYTVFVVLFSPKTLVKNLVKNLAKNLVKNLAKNLGQIRPTHCPKTVRKTG